MLQNLYFNVSHLVWPVCSKHLLSPAENTLTVINPYPAGTESGMILNAGLSLGFSGLERLAITEGIILFVGLNVKETGLS